MRTFYYKCQRQFWHLRDTVLMEKFQKLDVAGSDTDYDKYMDFDGIDDYTGLLQRPMYGDAIDGNGYNVFEIMTDAFPKKNLYNSYLLGDDLNIFNTHSLIDYTHNYHEQMLNMHQHAQFYPYKDTQSSYHDPNQIIPILLTAESHFKSATQLQPYLITFKIRITHELEILKNRLFYRGARNDLEPLAGAQALGGVPALGERPFFLLTAATADTLTNHAAQNFNNSCRPRFPVFHPIRNRVYLSHHNYAADTKEVEKKPVAKDTETNKESVDLLNL